MIGPSSLRARVLPHGWSDLVRQLALFGGAYLLYRLVRGSAFGHPAVAFAHARDLIGLERALHFFVEPAVQAWATGSGLVIEASTWLYLTAQSWVLIGVLLYLYMFRNRSYYFVRNMLMVAMAVALVAYAGFPTAPPRLLPEWGFLDSVADLTGVHASTGSVNWLFNPYAAVPSMHVAFAFMLGWPLARLTRRRAVRVFWLCYPFVITFVTVATANHFLADAILGGLTAGLSAVAAAGLGRLRPLTWNFAGPPVAVALR